MQTYVTRGCLEIKSQFHVIIVAFFFILVVKGEDEDQEYMGPTSGLENLKVNEIFEARNVWRN